VQAEVLEAAAEPEVVVRAEVLVAELRWWPRRNRWNRRWRWRGGGKGGTGGAGGKGAGGKCWEAQPEEPAGRGGANNYNNPYANPLNNPYNQSRTIVPQFPPSAATNQQISCGAGRWHRRIFHFNTNDLLGGLEKIGREQSEFYILGYVPPETPEGSCHTLKVKLNRGGLNVRSRSGYCNARTGESAGRQTAGKNRWNCRQRERTWVRFVARCKRPIFTTAPNVARVNLAMEIPPESLKFNKDKGKYHANVTFWASRTNRTDRWARNSTTQ